MPARRRPTLHIRLVRLILRLFPAEFRGDFGADMEADLANGYRDAERAGRAEAAAFWWRTLPSMLRTGLRQHLDALARDLRFALRSMARTPAFTAVALLMIALGTGANAAMFSVIDAVMLRSPFTDPDRLAIVRVQAADGRATAAISLAQYRSLQDHAPAFEAVAALGGSRGPILTGIGEPRRLNVECVTGGMFGLLGAAPAAGRTFTADEEHPGVSSAMIVSYDFWQRDLAGAPDVVGRVLSVNGAPVTVAGIMPRRFRGPLSRNNIDGWLPLALGAGVPADGSAGTGRQASADSGPQPACVPGASINVFARLRQGLSLDAAARQATDSAAIARLGDWQGKTGGRLTLLSLDEQTVSDLRAPFLALLAAVACVLLIACANVANLQLERVFGRRRELAVRMAIGATRGRIVRQTLTENLVLYAAGCAAGLLAARWTLSLVVGLMPSYVPHLNDVDLNARVLAMTFGLALLAGLAVGLVPALQAGSPALIEELRVASPTSSARAAWIRQTLVAGQIALSLMLTVGAALMVRTFLTLRPVQPGFEATDKVTAIINLRGPSAADPGLFFSRLFDRLRDIPGVRAVSGSTYLPMSGMVSQFTVVAGDVTTSIWNGIVTPNYFDEMQIPLTRGRGFTDRDDRSAPPVAIVNEAMARKAWPDGDPIGRTVATAFLDGPRATRQVIGVIRDTRSLGANLMAKRELYVPFAQSPGPFLNVIIRTADPRDRHLPAEIRAAAAAVDPAQVVDRLTPFEDMLDSSVATPRFGAWMLGLFAAMALLLAAVGLAASIAWWVAQRTREIGVRMALGADAAQVGRLVVRQGLMIATVGIVLGLVGALLSTRLLAGWLYGVTPLDAATFAWSAAGMLAIAALASYLPARRATHIDPLLALRTE